MLRAQFLFYFSQCKNQRHILRQIIISTSYSFVFFLGLSLPMTDDVGSVGQFYCLTWYPDILMVSSWHVVVPDLFMLLSGNDRVKKNMPLYTVILLNSSSAIIFACIIHHNKLDVATAHGRNYVSLWQEI